MTLRALPFVLAFLALHRPAYADQQPQSSPPPSPASSTASPEPAMSTPAAPVAPSDLPSVAPSPSPSDLGPSPAPSPSPTASASVFSTTSVDFDAGTLGIGGGVTETFAGGVVDVRALTGFFDVSFNGTQDSVNYTGNVRLSNILLVSDYHPGGGSFHVGAGLSVGSTAATASGVPQSGGGFTINNTSYSSAQLSSVNAGIKLGTAPVLLLGFGGGRSHPGLGFNFDLGAIFENPTSYANPVYGPTPDGINDPSTPQGQLFAQNLATFRNDLKNAASYLQTYPVLNLGLAYHF